MSLRTTSATELTVFAAASLSDALGEIGAAWEKETGNKIAFNFASSSMLAQQITYGSADIFLSADEAKMDQLASKGLILKDTRASILSNTLVVIVKKGSRLVFSKAADFANPDVASLALAQTETVPAGIYAREYLEKAGLWNQVKDKVIPTENVRAALAAVETGNADAGIVYKTDAAVFKDLRIAWEVARKDSPKISYSEAVISGTGQEYWLANFSSGWLPLPQSGCLKSLALLFSTARIGRDTLK